MVDQIQQFEYQYLIADGQTSPAGIVTALTDSGIDLQGFSAFPHGPGELQIDLITDDAKVLNSYDRALLCRPQCGLRIARFNNFVFAKAGYGDCHPLADEFFIIDDQIVGIQLSLPSAGAEISF